MECTLKDVSIVIVTYRGDDLLRACLDSLDAACGTDPQIVVVDNSPSEETRFLTAAHANAVYVSSPGNPGFAGGNNRAMPHCDRPYVLLLNNDTVVHAGESILALARFLEANPRCGAVQGSGRIPGAGNAIAGCGSWITPYGFLWSPGFNDRRHPLFTEAHPCFMGGGFFLMFRRKDIPRFGGFLFRTDFWCYYEETDFCHRVWLAGMEVWYAPTVPIDHLVSRTAGRFRRADIMRRYLRNLLFSLKTNLSAASRIRILPFVYAMIAGHALLRLLRGDLESSRSDAGAIVASFRDRKRILAARRQVSRMRKASDREIFRLAMRRPPVMDFLKYIRSNA